MSFEELKIQFDLRGIRYLKMEVVCYPTVFADRLFSINLDYLIPFGFVGNKSKYLVTDKPQLTYCVVDLNKLETFKPFKTDNYVLNDAANRWIFWWHIASRIRLLENDSHKWELQLRQNDAAFLKSDIICGSNMNDLDGNYLFNDKSWQMVNLSEWKLAHRV